MRISTKTYTKTQYLQFNEKKSQNQPVSMPQTKAKPKTEPKSWQQLFGKLLNTGVEGAINHYSEENRKAQKPFENWKI